MTSPMLRGSLKEMHKRQNIWALYDRLYEGSLEEHFSNSKLQVALKDSNYYRLNLARTAVDAPMERTSLSGSGIVCTDKAARNILIDFWNHNEMDYESHDIHEKAYQYGNSVVIVDRDPEDDNKLVAYAHSPKDVMVFYDPARPRVKSHAVHIYRQFGNEYAVVGDEEKLFADTDDREYFVAEVYLPDVTQKWISEMPFQGNSVDPSTVDMRKVAEEPNLIPGVIPVFHFRTARTPLGRSRLADAAGPQMAINDTMTALMVTVKSASWRQRYLLSGKGDGDAFGTGASGDQVDADQFEMGPDTFLHFKGENLKAGSFDVSESKNFLQPIEELSRWLAKATDTPEHYYSTGDRPPSGESYRLGERPMTAVVEHCQKLFGATWAELFKFVLAVNGKTDVEATVAWAGMQQADKDFWQMQKEKRELGVPDKVLLLEGGYEQEHVDEWIAEKEKREKEQQENPPPGDNPDEENPKPDEETP